MRNTESRGAAMIYVILLLGMLSILGVGFMTLGEAGLKSVAADHACSKARARAVSIHRALCRRAAGGEGRLGALLQEETGEEIFLQGLAREEENRVQVWIRPNPEERGIQVETDVEWDGYHFSFMDDIALGQEGGEG